MAGASLRDIRRKIRSVGNIKKITRAMQMVAASKLRKVQDHLMSVRPYSDKIAELLGRLSPHAERLAHPLFEQRRQIRRTAVVVITADKGLCGSYNSNMLRHAERSLAPLGSDVTLTTIGRKAALTFDRRGPAPAEKILGLPIAVPFARIVEMTKPLIDDFVSGRVDRVLLYYTRFVNAMTFTPTTAQFLPVAPPAAVETDADYIFEPGPEAILEHLVPRYVQTTFQRLLLESFSSEYAARMNAMKLATDNASEMITSLTLTANKARQSGITAELLDIVGGAEALSA